MILTEGAAIRRAFSRQPSFIEAASADEFDPALPREVRKAARQQWLESLRPYLREILEESGNRTAKQ